MPYGCCRRQLLQKKIPESSIATLNARGDVTGASDFSSRRAGNEGTQPEVVLFRACCCGIPQSFSTMESGARLFKHPAKSRYVTKSASGSRVDELFLGLPHGGVKTSQSGTSRCCLLDGYTKTGGREILSPLKHDCVSVRENSPCVLGIRLTAFCAVSLRARARGQVRRRDASKLRCASGNIGVAVYNAPR